MKKRILEQKHLRAIRDLFDAKYLKGVHSDECWEPIHKLFQAVMSYCEENGLNWGMVQARYEHENGVAVRKRWIFEVSTEKTEAHGHVVAAGAGTVQDPLDKYDIIATIG